MAPVSVGKRPRNTTDELYDDPGPSLLDHHSKRPRYSTVTTNATGDHLLSATPEPANASQHQPRQSQYRDFQNVDDSDDEDGTEGQAALAGSAMTQNMENQASDHAIIEEVRCINFMCHAHLEVKLGPLINFIIGHNGSGKSAVLTAITLCLGGKATATNRGQSLKSFITEGKDACNLAVKLKNQGPSAYKPDQYGSSIIVERYFSRFGTSNGFKLKSSSGGIVSTKRADLDELLDAWSLQLDNPMNVLTQDQARQFLNRSDPSHKYRFFMNGTQLAALDHAYRSLDDVLESIENILEDTKDAVHEKKQEYEESHKRVQLAEKQKGLQDKINDIYAQLAWAQVEEQEAELVKRDEEIREAQDDLRLRTEEAATAEEESQEAARAHQRAEDHCEEVRASLRPAEDTLQDAKAQFKENSANLQSLVLEQRNIGTEVTTFKKRKDQLASDIRDEQSKIAGANDGMNSSKLQALENAKDAHRQAERDSQAHHGQYDDLKRTRESAQETLRGGQLRLKGVQDDKADCQTALQNLEKSRGNWMAAYNPNLPQLLRAIEDETRFQKKPIGPVGRHIRLLKEDWSRVVELYLGGALNTFIVTSKNDQKVLSEIMARTRCELPIQIGNSTPIDTSRHEPDSNVLTVKRALEIDDPLVFKSLVINQSIEQVALVSDRDEAFDFMFGGTRPPKVTVCLCLNDDGGLRLAYTSSGEQSAVPVRPNPGNSHPAPRMKGNDEYHIRVARDQLNQKQTELDQAEKAKRQLDEGLKRAEQAIKRHEIDRKEHNLAVQRADELVSQLQQELEDDTPDAGRLEALEQELAEVEDNLRISEGSFRDSVKARDRLNEKARALKQDVDARQAEFDELAAKLSKAEIKARDLDDKRHFAIAANNAAVKKIEDARSQVANTEDARSQQVQTISEFIEEARKVSPRVAVPTGQTHQHLEKVLTRLQKQQEAADREFGMSFEDLLKQLERLEEEYRGRRRNHRSNTALYEKIGSSLAVRQDRWKKFRKFIRLRAVNVFEYLLSERDFRGHLDISHRDQTLKIRIEPDITKSTDKGRQTSTLSGGEKSFATICLLIALWDAMGSPIRCLDEFDVFMDNVNRDVSMKMIIRAARRSVGRQFIFITPQSMSSVALDRDVKVIKMSDPERGQTTLPFGS